MLGYLVREYLHYLLFLAALFLKPLFVGFRRLSDYAFQRRYYRTLGHGSVRQHDLAALYSAGGLYYRLVALLEIHARRSKVIHLADVLETYADYLNHCVRVSLLLLSGRFCAALRSLCSLGTLGAVRTRRSVLSILAVGTLLAGSV